MQVTIFAYNKGKRDSLLDFSLPRKCDIYGLNMVGGQAVITRIVEKPLPHCNNHELLKLFHGCKLLSLNEV